jgi:hypothetical protein
MGHEEFLRLIGFAEMERLQMEFLQPPEACAAD